MWRLVVLSLVAATSAQRLAFGTCPQPPSLPDFDVEKMVGEWYEVERSFYLVEAPLSCTRVNFTLNLNRSLTIDVGYKVPWRGELGSTRYLGEEGPAGVIAMKLSGVPGVFSRLAPGAGSYTVLHTDYTHHALIYSCTNFRLLHADFIWILGRSLDLSASMRADAYARLDKLGIGRERLLLTRHSDC